MKQRFKLPPGGDVSPTAAARRLGLSLAEFRAKLPELQQRKPPFPLADPTTGNYALEEIDEWRKVRHAQVNLTSPQPARDARDVVKDRMRGARSG